MKTKIHKNAYIGEHVLVGKEVSIGKGVYIEEGVSIGTGVSIGEHSSIYQHAIIGEFVIIGRCVKISANTEICHGTLISEFSRIIPNVKIDRCISITSGYNYRCNAYTDLLTDTDYIRLGCHTYKVSEWDINFDNNVDEFPLGSMKRELRWNVYNYLKNCLNLIRIRKGEEK